jgi:hypothetical protein
LHGHYAVAKLTTPVDDNYKTLPRK